MESDFFTLTCPSCGAKTRSDILVERIVCEYCGNEHVLRPENRPVLRPEIPRPPNIQLEREKNAARLVQRWFSLKFIPMAFFALAWDSFLLFWYSTVIGSGAPWIMIVFPAAHVAVGIGVTYYTLAGFLNRTVLEVSREDIAVWFEPLPWLGEKRIKTQEVKQFFCKDRFVRTKNGGHTLYELYVVTSANQQVKLLGNLDSPDGALYFEQQLERWLRIEDRPVAGELRD